MTQNEMIESIRKATDIIQIQQELINVLYSQVADLSMMSKIELGDDVIDEIKRLKGLLDGFESCSDYLKINNMNKERYNQIVDEAYENYINITQKEANDLSEYGDRVNYRPYSKEQFINKCKTNPEFSENWGLKIEERELSREERIDLYAKEYTPGMRNKYEKPFDDFIDAKLKIRNIPTKLITLTYNNETIESYE